MNVISLTERRNAAEKPDDEFLRKDDFGRPMQVYLLDYQFQDASWSLEIVAYSMDDAKARVDAMRESLSLLGQMHSIMPA